MEEKSLGKRLIELRKKKDWTQKKVAEKLHVTDKAVSRWELDKSSPEIDMIYNIAKLYDEPFEELLKLRLSAIDTENFRAIAQELEKKARKAKKKLRWTILLSGIIIISLCAVIFFISTFNKFQVYGVDSTNDNLTISGGVYINTNVQDMLYLGKIKTKEDIDLSLSTIDLYIQEDDKEILLKKFNKADKNLELEMNTAYVKINNLEDYFDKMYIRVNGITSKGEEKKYTAKLNFYLKFSNNKLIYLKNNEEYYYAKSRSKKETQKILEKLKLTETNPQVYKSKDKKISYYQNEKKLSYINEENGTKEFYDYYLDIKYLNVVILNEVNNKIITVEKYTYNTVTKDMECIVGLCNDYEYALNILEKYIKELS